MADLDTGGYGSSEGTKEVVCIVVIVLASGMVFFPEGARECEAAEGKDDFREGQESKPDGFRRELIGGCFFFCPYFRLLLVVANLQK